MQWDLLWLNKPIQKRISNVNIMLTKTALMQISITMGVGTASDF